MDYLNLAPTVNQTSWLLNLFCYILYSFFLFIAVYFLVKLYYDLLIEGIKAWKNAFQAIKEFYSLLTMRNIKSFFSCLGLITYTVMYCLFVMIFYPLIAPFHAFYLLCTGQYPGNRPQ